MRWTTAVTKARKQLKVTGFVPVKKGTKLYTTAKRIMSKAKH
jgi:hypothetical protein